MQLKFLIEGEEEVGSEHLNTFVAANHEKLACDMVVISDCSQFGPGQPAITYGLRGIAYYELRLTGPKQDLHSGTFGGAVTNPAIVLSKMLAALIDQQAHSSARLLRRRDAADRRERQQFASLPFDEAEFMKQIGVEAVPARRASHARTPLGAADVRHQRPHERLPRRRGENGAARAGSAKFSFRLVPNQDPAENRQGARSEVCGNCAPRDHDGD